MLPVRQLAHTRLELFDLDPIREETSGPPRRGWVDGMLKDLAPPSPRYHLMLGFCYLDTLRALDERKMGE